MRFSEQHPAIWAEYTKLRAESDRGSICHAPSVNLNFDQTGLVSACCFNRRYLLGSYPAQTLKQIWEGEPVLKLRDLLKNEDLSQGCTLCEEQLAARNFSGLRAKSYDGVSRMPGLKASPVLMPRIMEFETSNICNLECIMCNGFFSSSIRKNREMLEPTANFYDDEFVTQLRDFIPYLGVARFLGGEPFLNPTYYKIWEAMIELNPNIDASITTNATTLNDKGKRLVWDLKPGIVVSCDSLDKKVYESIRKNANFEVVRENIDHFLKLSIFTGKAMAIVVCPMVVNWQGLPEILKFCCDHFTCFEANMVVWPPHLSLRSLPAKKLIEVVKFLEQGCPESLKTEESWLLRHNYRSYHGMLNQVRAWVQELEANVHP